LLRGVYHQAALCADPLARNDGQTSRDRQEQVARCRAFTDGCCFQVIYFNSNISFLPPAEVSAKASVETGWITHTVKDA
jgi:hypothetical protein